MYDNMKMNKGANPTPKVSMNSHRGKDALVPVKGKYPLKSAFWRQKKMKGEC